MDALDAIRARRSVKQYDPEHVMSDEDLNTLIDHARLAPSSFNIQHWRYVAVRDVELRRQLRAAAWDQAQVSEASILFVVCADVGAWKKDPERYWRDAPPKVGAMMVPMIGSFYQGKEQLQRDEALRSVGLSAATLMITAKAMGYDSSPMIGFDAAAVGKLVRLPQDHIVAMMIAVGKPVKAAWPRPGLLSRDEVLIRDHF